MKTLKFTIVIVLCIALSLSFSANTVSKSEFNYQEEGVTVIFDTESVFSAEQKQFIADRIVVKESIVDDSVSTYSWCWLTGHDIINESVTVVEHKVRTENPRCLSNIYTVESCSKCDHMDYTLVASNYIFCCPEE